MSSSAPAHSSSPSPIDTPKSMLFSSVKRSFSLPRLTSNASAMPPPRRRRVLYSTPDERPVLSVHHRPMSDAPPSISQIAVGLHVSRTPHLPKSRAIHRPGSHQHTASVPVAKIPPQPTTHVIASSNSSGVSAPSTPASSLNILGRTKRSFRGPFFPKAKTASIASDRQSSGSSTTHKVVRFTEPS